MPHPKELLDSITEKLLPQYPRSEFTYVYEQGLNLTDRRNQPDIQIFDASRALLCAIEIGYTRPEKLKLYVDQHIPDVRWYSKAGELIWTNDSARLTKEPMVREIKYRVHEQDLWRVVLIDGIGCATFTDAAFAAQRHVHQMVGSRYAKARAAIKEVKALGAMGRDHEDIMTRIWASEQRDAAWAALERKASKICSHCHKATDAMAVAA